MKKTISLILAAVLLLSLYACGKEDSKSAFESDLNIGITDEIALSENIQSVQASTVMGDDIFLVATANDGINMLIKINLENGKTESLDVEIDTTVQPILFAYLDEIRLISGSTIQTVDTNLSLSEEKDLTRIFDGAMILSAKSDSQGNIYFIANDKVIVTDGGYYQKSEVSSSARRYRSIAISGEGEVYAGFLTTGDNLLKLGALGGKDSVGISGSIINGDENFSLYLNGDDGLYGLNPETGETLQLFGWLPNGIVSSNISAVYALSGNRFAVMTNEKLMVLGGTDGAAAPQNERTELTLACLNSDGTLPQAVAEFNSTNPDYYITMTDYWDNSVSDGFTAGLNRLNLEIMAGKTPDIFYMWGINGWPIDAYIRQGIFADLYTFLDEDPDISRNDFFETVLSMCEEGGKLQFLPEFFTIEMLGGRASVIGTDGMTIDGIIAFAEENSENLSEIANFQNFNFLRAVIECSADSLIDWETGECYFESEEFIRTLEASKLFGYDRFSPSNPPPSDYEPPIWSLTPVSFSNMLNYLSNIHIYGDDYVAFGFPTTAEPAVVCDPVATLAISSACKDKESAWGFVRQFFVADTQVSHATVSDCQWLPSNPTAFNKIMAFALGNADEYIDVWGFDAPTEGDVTIFRDVISSINVLGSGNTEITSIVLNAAEAYFAGDKTAVETASIIQSRAQICVSEQMLLKQ